MGDIVDVEEGQLSGSRIVLLFACDSCSSDFCACVVVPRARCMVSIISLAAGVVAASSGLSWIAAGRRCICDCSHNVDRDLLAVLAGQLARCGPDHLLCPTCPRSEGPWSVTVFLTVISLVVSFLLSMNAHELTIWSRVWVYYGRDDNDSHERICLAWSLNPDCWIIATLDGDMCEERTTAATTFMAPHCEDYVCAHSKKGQECWSCGLQVHPWINPHWCVGIGSACTVSLTCPYHVAVHLCLRFDRFKPCRCRR